jgi:hypothetical protein
MSHNGKTMAVGDTKEINASLYILVPKKPAKERGIKRRTRWRLTIDGNDFTYHFLPETPRILAREVNE